ncbi:MAG TPA: hypothetical protein VFD29_03515 [Gillisia sp.]|nr:hypothetical protein [Gillisia sp.]
MRRQVRHRILSSIIVMLLSIISWGQSHSHKLPEPQMTTDDVSGEPPPPGLILPIDDNIYLLATAGLALGIYFLRIRKIS